MGAYHCKHLMLFLISPKPIYTICIIDDNNTLGIMRGDAIWWARHPSGHQSSGTTNEITCIHQMKPRSSWVAVMGDQVTVIWTASGTSYFAQTGVVSWDYCCQAGNVMFLWILCNWPWFVSTCGLLQFFTAWQQQIYCLMRCTYANNNILGTYAHSGTSYTLLAIPSIPGLIQFTTIQAQTTLTRDV